MCTERRPIRSQKADPYRRKNFTIKGICWPSLEGFQPKEHLKMERRAFLPPHDDWASGAFIEQVRQARILKNVEWLHSITWPLLKSLGFKF